MILMALLVLAGGVSAETGLNNGAVWRDTDGNQIEAHGGNIIKIK
jgi:hypothetical protein